MSKQMTRELLVRWVSQPALSSIPRGVLLPTSDHLAQISLYDTQVLGVVEHDVHLEPRL